MKTASVAMPRSCAESDKCQSRQNARGNTTRAYLKNTGESLLIEEDLNHDIDGSTKLLVGEIRDVLREVERGFTATVAATREILTVEYSAVAVEDAKYERLAL